MQSIPLLDRMADLSQVKVVRPEGGLDQHSSARFSQQLEQSLREVDSTLVVDLQQIDVLDVHGLLALVSGLKIARQLGKQLMLCSAKPSVLMVLELTRLDSVFEILEAKA